MKNILILCTGNSARSILGEFLLNHLGQGRVRAYSAGSRPTGVPNPVALDTLQAHGIDPAGARSKSWDEFAGPGAPSMDLVITVCASAAGETCPIWPGAPVQVHWGLEDPAAVDGEAEKRAAFEEAYRIIETRVKRLLGLPLEGLTGETLKAELKGLITLG